MQPCRRREALARRRAPLSARAWRRSAANSQRRNERTPKRLKSHESAQSRASFLVRSSAETQPKRSRRLRFVSLGFRFVSPPLPLLPGAGEGGPKGRMRVFPLTLTPALSRRRERGSPHFAIAACRLSLTLSMKPSVDSHFCSGPTSSARSLVMKPASTVLTQTFSKVEAKRANSALSSSLAR